MSLPLLHAGRTNPGLSAQLDLRFALDKSLTAYRGPTPSFSRASTGSYFDGSGVLRYAALNINLYSEQFENAVYTKSQGAISANQTTAPDGATTADKFTASAGTVNPNVYQSVTTASASVYTFSIYVKKNTHDFVQIVLNGVANGYANFDIANGAVGTVGAGGSATASIINSGSGWYRCVITYTTASTAGNGYINLIGSSTAGRGATFVAAGTESVYLWGQQLELSSTVGTYCPTTSSANSAPRFDHTYNGTSWVSRGLLVEEQRTNAVLQSSFQSGWTGNSATLTANSASCPDGTNSAMLVVPSSGGNFRAAYQSISGVNCISVFAKASGKNHLGIVNAGGTAMAAWFNLSTGEVGTVVANYTATITSVGSGWYRCSLFSSLANYTIAQFCVTDANGSNSVTVNGSDGILLYGAQAESGSFSTSLIPTTTASATRSADVCQITGSDFSGFWNGTEGTIAFEADVIGNNSGNGNQFVFGASLSSSAANNQVALIRNLNNLGGDYGLFVNNAGTPQVQTSRAAGSWSVGSTVKAAAAYKLNDFADVLNGGAAITDTSGTIPTVDQLSIGNFFAGGGPFNGHIARLRYYNKRLPNATLQLLSDPDPTLNLQFALNKTLTPVAGPAPSFSRASTGTYFNASGVLTSASINTPRFDHVFSGGQWVSRGLLIEEQRTNLATYSEDLSHFSWIKLDTTISTNNATAPDGTQTADLIYPTTSGDYRVTYKAPASTNGQTYTMSLFAKASGINWISIPDATGGNFGARFNLSNGTIGTVASGITAAIQNCGNGWYRCSVTLVAGSGGTVYIGATITDDGSGTYVTKNGTNGVLIWGAQVELGAFPTSYIPTTISSVTRSADVCQITGTSFNWMWNQGEGSFLSEVYPIGSGSTANQGIVTGNDGTFANVVGQIRNVSNLIGDYGAFVRTGNSTQVSISRPAGSMPAFASSRAAFGYKLNDFADSLNGVAPITDTVGTVPTVDRLTIGDFHTGASTILNGCISQIIYYPARLTNTKLQQLST